ncbi:MAG: hypothetical protein ABSA85_12490 [Terracidiphilus sp.]|jgi:hypothetical protein
MRRTVAGGLLAMGLAAMAWAQGVNTTTVQGTVYLANGQPGAGTLAISWPAFTTAAGQAVIADSMTVTIAPDGFVSVNLAPNLGATPAGEYYTAVYYMSDGTVSTQYWVVPATANATLAQVQAQVMPAAQAVQTVSKTYVDDAITEMMQSQLTASGGTLTGPLYLNADPTQPLQAATKHYVDTQVATALPLTGGTVSGAFSALEIGAAYQADQFPGADFGAKVEACVSALNANYGGTCDARNFTGNLAMGSNLTIATPNAAILLPCATIATASQIVVTAGTRNVSLRGCALRGGSATSGSQGGTVFAYSGTGAMVMVGDATYAVDTPGFHMDNVAINTTAATSATAQGLIAYRTQELDLESLYFLGNQSQTGMTLDGTGNYTGGTFLDNQFTGFGTAVNAIGHQAVNSATGDWMNASTFVRLHIDCPTSSGNPISGTYGINLQQGDGNTFTGGDIEGCATALHLGANAENNTIVGLRNENSTNQIVADAGSQYNNWMTGGTMFTGKLTDNGTRNSFLDTFHRSFNGLNGDWYGSQQDATLTNHFRLGIGNGNERGLLNEVQTDYGYRWLYGFSDGSSGQQLYDIQDLLNSVYRLQIQQWNHGQSSTNNQTALNAAGTGNVCFNCSSNAGTGGVSFSSGGATPATVATVDSAGDAQFNGTLQVGGTSQSTGTMTVRNNADAEVDYYLWPGLTTSQKASYTYKDWNGSSQWYMVKDQYNNWALISAVGGLDSFKAYQSSNSGDTYIDTSNATGHIRLNYESGSGTETDIYSGSSANLVAAFQAPTSIKFPGLAATSGHFCLQVDSAGGITNTGSACGTGSGSGSGTVNSGNAGQVAYYAANGTTLSGETVVPIATGGTGATSASGALSNMLPGASSDGSNGLSLTGSVNAAGYKVGGSPFGTANLADWTNSGIANGLCAVWNSAIGKWGPGSCATGSGGYAGVTSAGTGGLAGNPGSAQTWEITPAGGFTGTASMTSLSPVCDIRAYGAKIDNATDIGPYIQDCVNEIYPWTGGVTWTILLPCGATPCYWDNPSALTFTYGGPFRFELQGYLRLGSTLVASGLENWYGIGPPGEGLQFQQGTPALITGPTIYGTLGTAITGEDAAVTITPTFSSGDIAHLPAGSAITIGETSTATASASRISYGGYGLVTLTLSSSPRFLPMETLNVSGCSDSSFNITGGAILKMDYSAPGGEQVTYGETATTTASTATGCTVTSFDEDKFESARVFCSNGVNMSGFSYGCGAGQITIVTEHPHSNSAQWGAVAFSPQYADEGGHTVSDLDINGCYGMCYWGELESNLEMNNVGVSPAGGFLSAGGMEETASWVGYVKQLHTANSSLPLSAPLCGGGGCAQPSYPFGLRCDSESPAAGYGAGATGCASFSFDGGSAIGGIKIDGGGRRDITAFPWEIQNMLVEQAPNAALTIDNRFPIDPTGCLSFSDNAIQDSITGMVTYDLVYTNNESPSNGCFKLSDINTALTSDYTNPYFNDAVSIDRTPYGAAFAPSSNNTAATGVYNDGVEMQAAARGSGAGFGPQVLPFGSLAIDNSPNDWAADCTTAGCTAVTTNVSCPDGTQATSKMQCAELDGPGSAFNIGTWTGSTYAGDQFIYGCYIRPGANYSFPSGLQNQDAFMLWTHGSDTFTPNGYGGTSYTTPSFGFGTKLAHNTWYPLIAIATIASGESASHTINFMIGSGNGNGGSAGAGYGNQFSNCRWAFVPGPNNPAYTGVTQDEVAYARDNQYRGAAPSSMSAGTAATGEVVSASSYQVNGSALGTANLADWTDSGAANGYIPIWNATTGKWTPGTASTATSATNFTGSLSGDVTGTQSATTVSKINGGSVPTSSPASCTNSSGQIVACATTGSGNVVLATSPTLTTPTLGAASATSLATTASSTLGGSANVFNNAAAATNIVEIQAGTSAAQTEELQWQNYSGTAEWLNTVDTSYTYHIKDAANSLDRMTIYQGGGDTTINAGSGAYAVCLNCAANSGTSGLLVQNGASSPSTVLTVSGSGNTTATGFLSGKFFMGTGTMSLTPGAAAGSSPSIACATSHVCDGVSGTVTLTTGTSPTTGTLATLSFPNTHTNYANCMVMTENTSGTITTNTWTESATAITITANAALTASTAYTMKYWCGGN